MLIGVYEYAQINSVDGGIAIGNSDMPSEVSALSFMVVSDCWFKPGGRGLPVTYNRLKLAQLPQF